MDEFDVFLSVGEAEPGAVPLAHYAEDLRKEFSTVEEFLHAPSDSSALSKLHDEMSGKEWRRFVEICEAAKEKKANDASISCLKILAQAAFHTYHTDPAAPSPFQPPSCLKLVDGGDRTLDDVQIRMQVYRMCQPAADDVFVAAIRGSDNVENWLVNLQATLVPADTRLVGELPSADASGPVTPMVHYAWQKIAVRLSEVLKEVLPKQVHGSASQLYCVGHSLGGSLSILLALAWAQSDPLCKVHALTWGAPMVGNVAFNELCKAQLASGGGQPRVVQFVNEADVVPKVPTAALGFSPWPESRVSIDTAQSRNLLGPIAAAPCAINMLVRGHKAAAVGQVRNGTLERLKHMHSCDLYFHLMRCYLGERSVTQIAGEQGGVANLADMVRAAALIADGLPRGEAPVAAAPAPCMPPAAGLALGAAGLAVNLIGHGMTLRSLSQLKESVGGLTAQLGQTELGLVEKMEGVQAELSSQIAALGEQTMSKLAHVAGSIPGHLRDARLDGYKEKLLAAVERLQKTSKVNNDGAATGEIVEIMREIDKISGWIKQWLLSNASAGAQDAEAKQTPVLFMLMLVHGECIEVLAKTSDEAQVTPVLETQLGLLKWLAKNHGTRLWMSGGVSLSTPHALEGCLLLSRALATWIDVRPQLAEYYGLTQQPDSKDLNACFRAIAFDPTNWMPWLHVASHSGFTASMPPCVAGARVCEITAGALADGDPSVVMAAASLLEEALKQWYAQDGTLDPLKPSEWLAQVVGAFFVHVHSPAVMPCMQQLVCRLAGATWDTAAGTSMALDFLRATHQMVLKGKTSEALPEMMQLLSDSFADASFAAEPSLYVGLSAALQFCIDSMKTMGQEEMGFVFADGMRVNLGDLELPERITCNAAAMAQVTMARAQTLRLLEDTIEQFDSFAQDDIMCPHQMHVEVLRQRAEHLAKTVETEKLRVAYLRELGGSSPDMERLQRAKERLSCDGSSDSWLATLAATEKHVLKKMEVSVLLSQCKDTKVDCNAMLDDMVSTDLPYIMKTLANVEARRKVEEELSMLKKGTAEFKRELRSTVVFTGNTSAGKTTSISALLCSAEQPLRTALLPASQYENTNSVTEVHLHPISPDFVPSSLPLFKRTVGNISRSFDSYEPLRQLLVDLQHDAQQDGRMVVDSREIHLYQSRMDVEMLLVDTPGLGGTNDMVRQALEGIVQQKLFLCVVVINCTSPSPIGGEVLTTLRKLAEISQISNAYVPPVFVFTHWDRVTDKEGFKAVLRRLARDLRSLPGEGGAAVLSEGMPCFFASINGRDALDGFERGLDECAAGRDVAFLLDFLCMYCGGLEGMLRSLQLLTEAESTVQSVTNTLFKNNEKTKLFSDLSEKELDNKAGDVKKEFYDKLTEKLKLFPSNAAELRKVVAALGSTSSLSNMLDNATTYGPKAVDDMSSLRPANGRLWIAKSKRPEGWCEMSISFAARQALQISFQKHGKPISENDHEIFGRDSDGEMVAKLANWEQLSAEHEIVLRKNQYIWMPGGKFWMPKSNSRSMVTYQTQLSMFFSQRFAREYLEEIADLQKESMDELTAQIEGMLDVEKLIPGAMEQVKKISLASAGVSMGLGMGATAAIISSTSGVLASLGALSATGVGLVVALPLMGLAGWWGYKQTYGLSEEECVDKTLDYFLNSFTKQIPDFKNKVSKEFDKAVDSFVEKLKNYRSQTESPKLASIVSENAEKRQWIEKELSDVLKKLSQMDLCLCGDAEFEKIVKEIF